MIKNIYVIHTKYFTVLIFFYFTTLLNMERQSHILSSFGLWDSILCFPSLTNYSFSDFVLLTWLLFDLKSYLDWIFFFLYPLSDCNCFLGFKTHTLAWRRISANQIFSWDSTSCNNRCFTSLLQYFTDISYLTYPKCDLQFLSSARLLVLLCFTTHLESWSISLISTPPLSLNYLPYLLT